MWLQARLGKLRTPSVWVRCVWSSWPNCICPPHSHIHIIPLLNLPINVKFWEKPIMSMFQMDKFILHCVKKKKGGGTNFKMFILRKSCASLVRDTRLHFQNVFDLHLMLYDYFSDFFMYRPISGKPTQPGPRRSCQGFPRAGHGKFRRRIFSLDINLNNCCKMFTVSKLSTILFFFFFLTWAMKSPLVFTSLQLHFDYVQY